MQDDQPDFNDGNSPEDYESLRRAILGGMAVIDQLQSRINEWLDDPSVYEDLAKHAWDGNLDYFDRAFVSDCIAIQVLSAFQRNIQNVYDDADDGPPAPEGPLTDAG